MYFFLLFRNSSFAYTWKTTDYAGKYFLHFHFSAVALGWQDGVSNTRYRDVLNLTHFSLHKVKTEWRGNLAVWPQTRVTVEDVVCP